MAITNLNKLQELMEQLTSEGRLTKIEPSYATADNIMYRAIVNNMWASRDIPLDRYAQAALEIDEANYNSMDTLLHCYGFQPTEIGEKQLYETVATTEFETIHDIVNNWAGIEPNTVKDYYSYQKNATYQTTSEEIKAAFKKAQTITGTVEELFDEIFAEERKIENQLITTSTTGETTIDIPNL